ncbi:MAG TPA: STAS domain-containing protein [Steroidobacteraceae bacterium]
MSGSGQHSTGGLSAAATAPAIDGEAAFVAVSHGVFRLEAPLTFATVPRLRRPGLERIAAAAAGLEFDLHAIAASDSAGLALLVDWLAEARARQRTLRYGRAPETLLALARLSEVEALIAPAGTGG